MRLNLRLLAVDMVNFFIGLAEGFLALRFLLKLFGANATSGFASWIYDMSSVLLDPFRGIFPNKVLGRTYVFEFSTLFAMLIYIVVGLLILALIEMISSQLGETKKR